MASIGHIAVGMAAGRLYCARDATTKTLVKAMAVFSVISMLPDADVIGFALGVDYDEPWGHRGATHSLVFALLFALAVMALKKPIWRTATYVGLVMATHPLLDSLTNGGLGCALLWPFSNERFFAPWRPIPVAPIGLHMLSPRGLLVVAVELIVFAPLFLFATFPRKQAVKA